jgi:hypothetical protein
MLGVIAKFLAALFTVSLSLYLARFIGVPNWMYGLFILSVLIGFLGLVFDKD